MTPTLHKVYNQYGSQDTASRAIREGGEIIVEFRQYGKTGRQVSIIGLGCEYLDRKPYEQVKETIDTALDLGVNLFDVFMPGKEVRENIAKALGKNREKVMIQGHIGSTDVNTMYDISRDLPTVKRYFEDMLRIFGGYIDFGFMFYIDSEEDFKGVFETGFAEYVQHLKKEGYIGHIGFSSHDPEMAIRTINTGLPEVMMFSINPAFDMMPLSKYALDSIESEQWAQLFRGVDPARTRLYELCEEKQIGITAMKAFGSGKLLSPDFTPFVRPLTTAQLIHYALDTPCVASVLPGCKNAAEMIDAANYLKTSQAERDYTEIISNVRKDFRGSCVYCSHCQPCPEEIDIAMVHRYLDIARIRPDNLPPDLRKHYSKLNKGADACTACGHCEQRCPFDVPVIANMRDAAKLLDKR